MTNRIPPQMIVVNLEGDKRGVTTVDFMSCCHPDETPVVWEGNGFSTGTWTNQLKVIGPEKAVGDPDRCGAGRGEQCCIFLICGAQGFECARFSSMRVPLIFRRDKMTAKRQPTESYPNCQLNLRQPIPSEE